MKHWYMTVDLRSYLVKPDEELAGVFVDREGGDKVGSEDARRMLARAYGRGFDVLPVCSNPNAQGHCACDEIAEPCSCGREDFSKGAKFCGACGAKIRRAER